jgi:hypothetical protein
MAVLVTAEVPGQTAEGYDGMLRGLDPLIRAAPGFICHAAYSDNGTWRVLEIWESRKAATDFFAQHVHPHLPPGVKPKRELHELHSCVQP